MYFILQSYNIKQIILVPSGCISTFIENISSTGHMFLFDSSCQNSKAKNFASPRKLNAKKNGQQVADLYQNFQFNSNKNNPESTVVNGNWTESPSKKSRNIKNQQHNYSKRWEVTDSPPFEGIKKINKSKSFNSATMKKVFEEYKPKAEKISIKQLKKLDLKEFRQSNGTPHSFSYIKLSAQLRNSPIQSFLSRNDDIDAQNRYKDQNIGRGNNARSEYCSNGSKDKPNTGKSVNQLNNNKTSLKEQFHNRNTLGNKQHAEYLRKMIRYQSQNQNHIRNQDKIYNQVTLQKNASQRQLLRNTTGGSLHRNPLRSYINEWREQGQDYGSSIQTFKSDILQIKIQQNILNNGFKKEKIDGYENTVRNAGKQEIHDPSYFSESQGSLLRMKKIPKIRFVMCQAPHNNLPMKNIDNLNNIKSMENIPEQENQEKQDLDLINKEISNFEKFSKRFFKILNGFQKQVPGISMNMNMNIRFQQDSKPKTPLRHSPDFQEHLLGQTKQQKKRKLNSPIASMQKVNSYTSGNRGSGKIESSSEKQLVFDSQKIQLVSSDELGVSQNSESKVLDFSKIKAFQQKYKGINIPFQKKQEQSIVTRRNIQLQKTIEKRRRNFSKNIQNNSKRFRPFNSPKPKRQRISQNLEVKNKTEQRYSESSVQQLSSNFERSIRGQQSPRIFVCPSPTKNNNEKSKNKFYTFAPYPLSPKMTESQIDANEDSISQKSNSSIVLYNAKMLNLSPNKNQNNSQKIIDFAYKKFDQLISRGNLLVNSKHKNEILSANNEKGKLGSTGIQDNNAEEVDERLIEKRGSHRVGNINQQQSIIQPCQQWSPSSPQYIKRVQRQQAQMLKRNPNSKLWRMNVVESVLDSGLQLLMRQNKRKSQKE